MYSDKSPTVLKVAYCATNVNIMDGSISLQAVWWRGRHPSLSPFLSVCLFISHSPLCHIQHWHCEQKQLASGMAELGTI